MKTLPESFGIMRDANNPLWDKYIAWLNERKHGGGIEGFHDHLYGLNNGYPIFREADTILTLEQWDSIVNGWQPKQGEIIEVRDGENGDWRENEFLCYEPRADKPFVTFEHNSNNVFGWKHARPINPTRKKIEELEREIERLKMKL